MNTSSIVSAVPSDKERIIATLVTAFTSDPFIRWMLPEPGSIFSIFLKSLNFLPVVNLIMDRLIAARISMRRLCGCRRGSAPTRNPLDRPWKRL